MAKYMVKPNEFTELNETTGTIQNLDGVTYVEITDDPTKNTGLLLAPNEMFSWSNNPLYVRAAKGAFECEVRVLPFEEGGSGGGDGGGSVGPRGPKGEKGDKGDPGFSPSITTSKTDGVTTITIVDSAGTKTAIINDGAKGDDGKDGKSFQIKAQYTTEAALRAAHPTGAAGDAYLVGSDANPDLYLWMLDTTTGLYDWVNVGKIAGVKGDKGDKGDDGDEPVVTLTKSGDVSTLTITTSTGSQTVNIYDGINGNSIEDWATSTVYAADDIVVKNGQLYRCLIGHASGTWGSDTNKWELLAGLQTWMPNTTYFGGSLLYNNARLYRVNSTYTSGATFSDSNLTEIAGGGGGTDIKAWTPNTAYTKDELLVYDQTVYKVTANHTSGAVFSEANLKRYIAGEMVGATSIAGGNRGLVPEPQAGDDGKVLFGNGTWDTIPAMTGATSIAGGKSGFVPAPLVGDENKFLAGDGTWRGIQGSSLNVERTVLWSGYANTQGDVLTLTDDYSKYDYIVFTIGYTSGVNTGSSRLAYWFDPEGGVKVNPEIYYLSPTGTFEVFDMSFGSGGTTLSLDTVTHGTGGAVTAIQKIEGMKFAHVTNQLLNVGRTLLWEGNITSSISESSPEELYDDYDKYDYLEFICGWDENGTPNGSTELNSSLIPVLKDNPDFNPCPSFEYNAEANNYNNHQHLSCDFQFTDKTHFCGTVVRYTKQTTTTGHRLRFWKIYGIKFYDGGSGGTPIENWVSGNSYSAGDLVIYSNDLYQCITANSDSTWTPAKWQKIGGGSSGTDIEPWTANTSYNAGDLLVYRQTVYKVTTAFTSGSTFSESNLMRYIAGEMIGASGLADGERGLVPKPEAGDADKVLFGDGTWKKPSDAGLADWVSGTSYSVGDCVIYDNCIYQCKTANSDTTWTVANWQLIGKDYTLPVANDTVLGGVKSTTLEGGIKVNLDGTMEYNKPKNSVDPVAATTAWEPDTNYIVNTVVGYGGMAYICLQDHTSSSDFDTDYLQGYWSKVDMPKVGASGYAQVLVMGVTGATSSAPFVKSLAINPTDSFILPPVEVLEEAAAESAIVNGLHFDNADAADFNYDSDFVKFDGTMHLKTEYDIPMTTPTQITDGTNTGYISESGSIDFDDWSNVEGVDVG